MTSGFARKKLSNLLIAVVVLSGPAASAAELCVGGAPCFATLQDAIAAAAANDTIKIEPGTYVESGQIVVSKTLRIEASDPADRPVIQTDQDTASGGDARGWWLVDAGVNLDLESLILDGVGFKIWQGIRARGSGSINDCVIRNIAFDASGPSYAGTGVVMFGSGGANWTIENSTFSGIGRIGIHIFGSGITDTVVDGITYTGAGPIDKLDYGVCVGGGAVATIRNSTFTACKGVASSDGSVSAGVLATTFFGGGTTAIIEENLFSDNSNGVIIGYDASDTTIAELRCNDIFDNDDRGVGFSTDSAPTVTVNYNNVSGNGTGLAYSGNVVLDAADNYWGAANGPGPAGSGDLVTGDVGVDPFAPFPIAEDCVSSGFLIDLRPNNSQNQINTNSRQLIPIAVLGAEGLEPCSEIDPATVRVRGASALETKFDCQDVNGDGRDDAVYYFRARSIGKPSAEECADPGAQLKLTAGSLAGVEFSGLDAVSWQGPDCP